MESKINCTTQLRIHVQRDPWNLPSGVHNLIEVITRFVEGLYQVMTSSVIMQVLDKITHYGKRAILRQVLLEEKNVISIFKNKIDLSGKTCQCFLASSNFCYN